MTRHLHLDPISGVSGDMLLGALIDLGAPVENVRRELHKLDVPGWQLDVERVTRHGITGSLAKVRTDDQAHHRSASTLTAMIRRAGLSSSVTAMAERDHRTDRRGRGGDPQ